MKRYSKIVKNFDKMRKKLERLACQCEQEKESVVQQMVCLQERKIAIEAERKCAKEAAKKIDEFLWGKGQ